jgi:hypothetical protein
MRITGRFLLTTAAVLVFAGPLLAAKLSESDIAKARQRIEESDREMELLTSRRLESIKHEQEKDTHSMRARRKANPRRPEIQFGSGRF